MPKNYSKLKAIFKLEAHETDTQHICKEFFYFFFYLWMILKNIFKYIYIYLGEQNEGAPCNIMRPLFWKYTIS